MWVLLFWGIYVYFFCKGQNFSLLTKSLPTKVARMTLLMYFYAR
jgi:hypothetical protein